MAEYGEESATQKQNATQRELQIFSEFLLGLQPSTDLCIHEESPYGQGKSQQSGAGGTVPGAHTGLGRVFLPPARLKSLRTHGTCGRILRRVLPQ